MIRNRSALEALPAMASPMPSADKMIIPASSIAASMMAGTFAFLTAKMYRYWASKLTYSSPASRRASRQVAEAMSVLPGGRSRPASLRMLVMKVRVWAPSLCSMANRPGPRGMLLSLTSGFLSGSCWREGPWLAVVPAPDAVGLAPLDAGGQARQPVCAAGADGLGVGDGLREAREPELGIVAG